MASSITIGCIVWAFRQADPRQHRREELLRDAGIASDAPEWQDLVDLDPDEWTLTRWYATEASYEADRRELTAHGWRGLDEDHCPAAQAAGNGFTFTRRAWFYQVAVTYVYAGVGLEDPLFRKPVAMLGVRPERRNHGRSN
jgi:hypothetical protein